MSKPNLTVTKDIFQSLKDALRALQVPEVLVGIPEDTTSRKKEGKQEINNATLLMINEYGTSDGKIPPREPVHTGMWDARPQVIEQFRQAAKQALSGGQPVVEKYLERAGIISSNQIKLTINNQVDMAPPAKATLAKRKRDGFKGIKSLIVTGQLRNAITYVVRPKRLVK